MITAIARKEFSEIVRDGRFRWMAALMVLLLLTAMLSGWQRFSHYAAIQATAQGSTNQQWLEQGDKNPHSAAHYGNYAFKPLGPLAFFDNGITSYAGTAVFMEAHKQNFAIARPASDSSAIARFGELNGAMILQLLLPLLIIFLGFTAFAGERESGTLRQLMSMGVSRSSLLWGKATGIAAAVLVVVLPCLVVAAVALAATGLETAGGGIGTRIALVAAAYLAYAATFLFLCLAVSAWAGSSRVALMVLVGFWAFTAFLMPKTAAEVSRLAVPSPAFGSFMADMKAHQQRGIDGISPRVRLAEYRDELFRQYGVSRVADLPVYWTAMSMQKLEELDHPVFEQHYNSVREQYAAQLRLQDRLGLLAPLLPLRSISMTLSGTDLIEHNKFMADTEVFRRDMVDKMNSYLSKAAANLNAVNDATNYMIANEDVFAIVPPFRYEPPALDTVIASQTGNFVRLAGWLVAAIVLALVAVRRMSLERN